MNAKLYYKKAMGVQNRYLIKGRLVLTSPTSLSNGEGDGLTDVAVRRDEIDGKPLLPGTSLAGALRDYLWQRLPSKSEGEVDRQRLNNLFGENDANSSCQSWLFVEDALGEEKGIEIRDGVAIEAKTRTAEDQKKFDTELLAAGTTFDLCFEFWEPASAEDNPQALRQLLALSLTALERGEVLLGGRKRRGFGTCVVEGWQVYRYSMAHKAGLVAWLEEDTSRPIAGQTLAEILSLPTLPELDALERCHLQATFAMGGSLLIRAVSPQQGVPDQVHLQNFAGQAVLSGTSLAGALRARAYKIARLLNLQKADFLINDLFGQDMSDEQAEPRAGRLWVQEAQIQGGVGNLVQSRVKIDRFTGGSYPAALFDQQPQFGGEVELNLTIDKPTLADVGLLLLLLKDLWTGDLPLGGETSVGRGRLLGEKATLHWEGKSWEIVRKAMTQSLSINGDTARLETAVQSLKSL